jgi:predicted aminopeptidase
VACGLAVQLSGCYVMQAATGQLDVMASSRPIPKVLADPDTPTATRTRIELASEARDFAIRELALPDSGSYEKYADLGRPYALWNVVATPEFSLKPLRWCFPIAGCVTYRGYFSEPDARAMAWKLAARGDDSTVEGVATYSTLGHFPDPLLNTMLGWRDTRLVGTIFHELAHERLYVAGDSEFNEAFATANAQEGVRRWLRVKGDAAALAMYEAGLRRDEKILALLTRTRAGLEMLYGKKDTMSVDEMRRAKVRFGLLIVAVGLLVFLILAQQAIQNGLLRTTLTGPAGEQIVYTSTTQL